MHLWRCLKLRYTTDSPEILKCHHTDFDVEVQVKGVAKIIHVPPSLPKKLLFKPPD